MNLDGFYITTTIEKSSTFLIYSRFFVIIVYSGSFIFPMLFILCKKFNIKKTMFIFHFNSR